MKLEKINSIKENDYAIPEGENYQDLAQELEKCLGSLDLATRDNSFYILYNWCTNGTFSTAELLALGERMIGNFSKELGKPDSDSVFLRSFSALTLCGVLKADLLFHQGEREGRKSFLTNEILANWLKQTIEAFIGEQDLRGYIVEKSWAHSIAHFGDLLIQFALSPQISKEEHLNILDAVAQKFIQPANLVFNTYEDGRLGRVITAILFRSLIIVDDFKKWLAQIETIFAKNMGFEIKNNPTNPNLGLNARTNIRLFLNTLYFMIRFGDKEFVTREGYKNSILHQQNESLLKKLVHTIKKTEVEGFYNTDKND